MRDGPAPPPRDATLQELLKASLSIAHKTLWGAAEMPFRDDCAEAYRHVHFEQLTHRLQQQLTRCLNKSP
jgi:hypothetical protein